MILFQIFNDLADVFMRGSCVEGGPQNACILLKMFMCPCPEGVQTEKSDRKIMIEVGKRSQLGQCCCLADACCPEQDDDLSRSCLQGKGSCLHICAKDLFQDFFFFLFSAAFFLEFPELSCNGQDQIFFNMAGF